MRQGWQKYLSRIHGKEWSYPATSCQVEVIYSSAVPQTNKQAQILFWVVAIIGDLCLLLSITDLCRKGRPIMVVIWTAQCQKAFCGLKQALSQGPVPVKHNFNKAFMVFMDASETDPGAVLLRSLLYFYGSVILQ